MINAKAGHSDIVLGRHDHCDVCAAACFNAGMALKHEGPSWPLFISDLLFKPLRAHRSFSFRGYERR